MTFHDLGLPAALSDTLARRGIRTPFPIQTAAIPDALAGRDICGKAPTGSGKTLAFGLPLLARVGPAESRRPRALVLSPTRELADQITSELRAPATAVGRSMVAVYGGVAYGPQIDGLRRGADVVVACPGRLEDLIDRRALTLDHVDIVVVDEADRMADMGFLPAVRRILDQTAPQRQTLLFSATLDGDIANLTEHYQRAPRRHEAAADRDDAADAVHHFWSVERHDRVDHTAAIVTAAWPAIVFTRTRHGADRLARQLVKQGVSAAALHGGRTQNQRTRALERFSSGAVQALVATDVAARGIHVDDVATVVHYDPPHDEKAYIHRSGRTARAGAGGQVVSLIESTKKRAARRMQQRLGLDLPIGLPTVDALDDPAARGTRVEPLHRVDTGQPGRSGSPNRPSHTKSNGGRNHRSIYVSNLPWSATAADLRSIFEEHGEVSAATVITDRRTGRSRGFGFVEMAASAVERAVEDLGGIEIDGREITVRPARPPRTGPRNDPRSTAMTGRRRSRSRTPGSSRADGSRRRKQR
jgi:superfamily II DNA/RNA helicase